ncbi:hypothetical protein UO65_6096 [Actinokineospora spheciospongiae]|uniref:Uncharacterized protein n=1 Tax=Actinokineospora spheciospongiae TaxID=909613 RepID=W7IX83_9PSEU|nr:hypothetical protein UO65_6096 [Actinokineospora spheciospongiae]
MEHLDGVDGERDQRRVAARLQRGDGLLGAVEQVGVQGEAEVGARREGQRAQCLVGAERHLGQHLERAAVVDARGGEVLVVAVRGHAPGAAGADRGDVDRLGGAGERRDGAAGARGGGIVGVEGESGAVDAQAQGAGGVGLDQAQPPDVGQPHLLGARPERGGHGEVDARGTGKHVVAADAVLADDPVGGSEGQGEHAVDRLAEVGVCGPRRVEDPVAVAGERVGGQRDAAAGGGPHRVPPGHVLLGQCAGAGRACGQLFAQFGDAAYGERRPDREVRASGLEGEREIGQRQVVGQGCAQPVERFGQRPLGAGGKGDDVIAKGRGLRRGRWFGDDQVGVGAAETEAGHGGDPPAVDRPRASVRHHLERAVVQVRLGVRLVEARCGRQLAVPQREQDLEQTGDPGGHGGVADVGLHRADRAVADVGGGPAVHLGERLDLDRVAQRGAGAVRLDQADPARVEPGAAVGVGEQRGLGGGAGGGDAVGLAVAVDAGGQQHPVHGVAVGDGPVEPLEHDHPDALAEHGSVGGGVERDAGLTRREHPDPAAPYVQLRGDHQRHPARDGHGALAAADRVSGQVHRDQRRRARGVHGHGRAVEVEEVADAGGQDRAGGAEERVAAVGPARLGQQQAVVAGRAAHEHAAARLLSLAHRVARVLQPGPRLLQEQPLLRVHRLRLQRREVEERRVEAVHIGQHGADPAVGAAFGEPVGAVHRVDVPAVLGHRAEAMPARDQVRPELVQVLRVGEAAGHADHRDGRVGGRGPGRHRGRAGGGPKVKDVGGQRIHRRVVVDGDRVDLDAEPLPDLPHDLHGADGLQAHLAEAQPRVHLVAAQVQPRAHGVLDGSQHLSARGARHRQRSLGSRLRHGFRLGFRLGFGGDFRLGGGGLPLAEPVALLLERVRRQRQPADLPARVAARPGHVGPADPALGQLGQLPGGEQVHQLVGGGGVVARAGGPQAGGAFTRQVVLQLAAQLAGGGGHDRHPLGQHRATGLHGVGDVGQADRGRGGTRVRGQLGTGARRAQFGDGPRRPLGQQRPDPVQPEGVDPQVGQGLVGGDRVLGHAQDVRDQRRQGRDQRRVTHGVALLDGGEQVDELPGVGVQDVAVAGAEHEQVRPRRVLRRRGRRRALQHDVGVGAPGPERADPRAQHRLPRHRVPGGALALHGERGRGEVNVRVGGVRVQGRHQLAVQHLHDHLADARDPGGALQVPDVGLDAADRPAARLQVAEGPPDALDLDGVTEGRAGAVGLQVADGVRGDTGVLDGPADDPGLRGGAGHGVAAALAGVVEPGALDDPEDEVTVGPGLGEGLEQHRADALAGDVTAAPFPEAAAPAVGGEELTRAELDVLLRVDRHVDPTGDGHRGLPRAQRLHRQVHGGEAGGAGGVDGHARAAEVQAVGDAVGDGAVHGGRVHAVGLEQLVVVPHHPDVDPDGVPGDGVRPVPGVLDGAPRGLEEQPLLRVHPLRLPAGDAEEGRVEPVDPVEERAPAAVAAPVGALVRVEEVGVRPPVGRDLGDAVDAAGEVVPEGGEVRRLRVLPGDPDDGYVLVLPVPGVRDEPRPGRLPRFPARLGAVAVLLALFLLGLRLREQRQDPVRLTVGDDEAAGAAERRPEQVEADLGGQRPGAGGLPRPEQGLVVDAHPTVGPEGPADRETAVRGGEVLGVGVAVGVVALPDVGQRRRDRGEGHERLHTARRLEEVARPRRLRGQDLGDVGVVLAEEQPVPDQPGAVEDPVDGTEDGPRGGDGRPGLGRVGDVGAQVLDLGAGVLPARDPGRQLRCDRPAPDEDEPGLVRGRQPVGEVQPEPARAAGDDVDPALLRRSRRGRGGREPDHLAAPPHPADLGVGEAVGQLREDGLGRGVGLDHLRGEQGGLGRHRAGERGHSRVLRPTRVQEHHPGGRLGLHQRLGQLGERTVRTGNPGADRCGGACGVGAGVGVGVGR